VDAGPHAAGRPGALRIGAYELLWCDDVPDAVAVSEAVALVADLSTDESAGFVNGLLARLLSLKPSLLSDTPRRGRCRRRRRVPDHRGRHRSA
jgi:hypothetical protein